MNSSPAKNGPVRTLLPLKPADLEGWKKNASAVHRNWVDSAGFKAKAGQVCLLPSVSGEIETCLSGMREEGWLAQLAGLPAKLPAGRYGLECDWSSEARIQAALGWGLACYKFSRYKKPTRADLPTLVLEEALQALVDQLLNAQTLVRDLVNTPTEHMGPKELADAILAEGDAFGADCEVIAGDDLLTKNFPLIHAVGRASDRAPRLVRLTWGNPNDPLVALVGKGVCFDTGGLNLKSTAGMATMKKDMGGAAHALALARLVMERELPVRLLLLVPAVENSVSGNAYRPGDVLISRNGLSIEIGNTDAEGRLVLADALTLASEEAPELMIDYATLTGAARVAMGPDIPPFFSNRDDVALELQACSQQVEDPLWRLPLYTPYKDMIKSSIADLNNSASSSYGGCITAALFLEHFIDSSRPWVHIDTFAWNQSNKPGRPKGGEALGLRAVFRYLEKRYAGD